MSGATTERAWSYAEALAVYRATALRISAWWPDLDVFEKAVLRSPQVVAADRAIQAAFTAQDQVAVERTCAAWEATLERLTGRPSAVPVILCER